MNQLSKIDSLLFQSALQARDLSQKRNEIDQQIKVCRASITESRSHIETMRSNTKKLEEEIRVRQSTAKHNKDNAKSMKGTGSLVYHYEQTLKVELDTRKANYSHDLVVYEERISSYEKTFQSYNECYLQNRLAQKLLMLQADKEEIENRIRACDDQITVKQVELDHLTSPAVNTSSPEKLPERVFVDPPITEQEKQSERQANEDSNLSIEISSLHLTQTTNDPKTSVDVNAEETEDLNKVHDSPTYDTSHENSNKELWSFSHLNEQSQPDEVNMGEEQNQETSPEDQEQQPIVSVIEDVVEDEMQGGAAQDEEEAAAEEDNQRGTTFSQPLSQESNPHSVAGKTIAVPSTPTFSFSFSPSSSPYQGTPGTKSPAFLFSLNSNVSTPGFTGFGFDANSSQEEDSSFAFASSLFHEKKATEKPSSCPEFLFGQTEPNEDFSFPFTAKSPPSGGKENTKDDLPFSFNF